MTTDQARQNGFTLTELTIVLVIFALLIGGLMVPLSAQRDLQNTAETQRLLAEAREALIGFAVTNGRLPCPDTDIDGAENLSAPTVTNNAPNPGQSTQNFSVCVASEGYLPFASIGTSRIDGWGNRFRYRVTAAFTQSSIVWSALGASGNIVTVTPGFSLNTPGDISVQTMGDNPATSGTVETRFLSNLATGLPALIVSHGKNGFGSRAADGFALPFPPLENVDEANNLDTGLATKISRFATPSTTPCSDTNEGSAFCEFDDIVDWISPNVLKSRMISGRRLP